MQLNLVEVVDTLGASDLLSKQEMSSLATNLRNCVESMEAGALMVDEQKLYSLSIEVAESIGCACVNDVAHTVWNIFDWLRQSLTAMMYLRFDLLDMVKHDLSIVPFSKIMPCIELGLFDLFDEGSKHHKHAMRYLLILNEILIEKGVV
ncbi:hypothetical protein CAL7716_100770 (plasmid) [Calothrix sp. PCC 7716]|nr:hypothetical protein CAL7716_100770 [Calothrix sp. PCC 7716]